MKVIKENAYIVIKKDDVEKYLSKDDIQFIDNILEKIDDGRLKDNKHPYNTYYVCNTDEPYADAVYKVIIGGEALKTDPVNKRSEGVKKMILTRDEQALVRLHEFIEEFDISCEEDVCQRDSVNEECVDLVAELVGIIKGA